MTGAAMDDVSMRNMANPVGQRDDSGLNAWVTLLALYRISADLEQLRHGLGHDRPLVADDLLRLARRQDGVKAKRLVADTDDLGRLPLPALANGPSGWFIIARVSGDEVLIQPPVANLAAGQPGIVSLTRAALSECWSGELVLVTTRESLGAVSRAFDVSWFPGTPLT